MAQWSGQYSGHTHDTRVQDLEGAMRLAVEAWKIAESELERRRKAKSVRNLAKRLLLARRRVLKARLVAAQHVRTEEAQEARAREIASLREREEAVSAGGVEVILAEFDAAEAMPSSEVGSSDGRS